ncbi:hypothetical protein MQX03_12185 [Chryseobacterium aahli]|uniref:hypothetical protein n=1 Tax=Chryseobacterium aahli TaxID=1278643 RepID=UPI001F61AAE1|nr:hypothetical protein [Chryseobacterium aahli]MCI3937961.1 hypothetical protein [Chryseobacterium aahli]
MNLICSIFLTFFTVFRPLIPLVEYAVNYQYISEELCVNKKNVDLHCNGKCYLAKELSKTNDTDSSPLSKGKNSVQKVLDFYIPTEIFKTLIENNFSFPNLNFTYKTGYTFHFLKNIFRPPIF